MTGKVISIIRNNPPSEPVLVPTLEKGKPWVTLADMCERYRKDQNLLGRLQAEGFCEQSLGAKMAEGRATRLMSDIGARASLTLC